MCPLDQQSSQVLVARPADTQRTAIDAHCPSHPILTGEASGPGAVFQLGRADVEVPGLEGACFILRDFAVVFGPSGVLWCEAELNEKRGILCFRGTRQLNQPENR